MTALLVAAGAFVGAPLRFLVASRFDGARFPYGTLLVNVAGSFVLGLLVGAAVTGHASPPSAVSSTLSAGLTSRLTTATVTTQAARLPRA